MHTIQQVASEEISIEAFVDDDGHPTNTTHLEHMAQLRYCNIDLHLSFQLTAITLAAPAFAANMERIPVPEPTSRTVFPLKR